ncbi:hypothetical protein DIRU0_C28458 [Diutina rugosa]
MEIPCDSFTAKRLACAPAETLSRVSSVVMVGGIPPGWRSPRDKRAKSRSNIVSSSSSAVTSALPDHEVAKVTYDDVESWRKRYSSVSTGDHSSVTTWTDASSKEPSPLMSDLDSLLAPSEASVSTSVSSPSPLKSRFASDASLNIVPPVAEEQLPFTQPPQFLDTGDKHHRSIPKYAMPPKSKAVKSGAKTVLHDLSKRQPKKVRRYLTKILAKKVGSRCLRRERMLVLVKEVDGFPLHFDETEVVESRIVDRLQELHVQLVVRQEECIDPEDSGERYYLEFFQDKEHKKLLYKVPFAVSEDGMGCSVNFYSQVDKSLALIQRRPRKHTRCFILISRSSVSSLRWLFLMDLLLGRPISLKLNVYIPDLEYTISISLGEQAMAQILKPRTTMTLTDLPQGGYHVSRNPAMHFMWELIRRQFERQRDPKLDKWLHDAVFPWFCFREYDRLEWAFDDSEVFFLQTQLVHQSSATLELRSVQIASDSSPPSVEGFVIRGTVHKKHDYLFTCGNLFLYCDGALALPPPVSAGDQPEIVYEVYPLDENKRITWLKSPFDWQRDDEARREYQRRVSLFIRSRSIVELQRVVDVKPSGTAQFVVEMDTGSNLSYTVQSTAVRDCWVERLGHLVKYWQQRSVEKTAVVRTVKTRNIRHLGIDDYLDSNIYDYVEQGEQRRAFADTRMFPVDQVTGGRVVLASGMLYLKMKKHANWNKVYMVLVPGYMLLCHYAQRSKLDGRVRRDNVHQRFLTLPLSRSFVYSGASTLPDLLERSSEQYHSDPGRAPLPRCYIDDGWRSSEEEYMRCFTVWLGSKRRLRGNKVVDEAANPGLTKMAARLGITGKSLVFMARSRQERERWMQTILSEIDREVVEAHDHRLHPDYTSPLQ